MDDRARAPETAAGRAGGPRDRCPVSREPVGGRLLPMAIRIRSAAVENGLAVPAGASNNRAMDPLVAAFAQLVRDRWAAERRAQVAGRGRMRVVEGGK